MPEGSASVIEGTRPMTGADLQSTVKEGPVPAIPIEGSAVSATEAVVNPSVPERAESAVPPAEAIPTPALPNSEVPQVTPRSSGAMAQNLDNPNTEAPTLAHKLGESLSKLAFWRKPKSNNTPVTPEASVPSQPQSQPEVQQPVPQPEPQSSTS